MAFLGCQPHDEWLSITTLLVQGTIVKAGGLYPHYFFFNVVC